MLCFERTNYENAMWFPFHVYMEYGRWCFYLSTSPVLLRSSSGVLSITKPPWVQDFSVRPGFSVVTVRVSE